MQAQGIVYVCLLAFTHRGWLMRPLASLAFWVAGYGFKHVLSSLLVTTNSLPVTTGLVGALALPMTLCTAMRVAFGSKWLVALRRAQAAGKMLAMQLAQVSQSASSP